MDHTRTTIKDVARHAGVSPATVSNVLRSRPSVAAPIALRVRAAVNELGYVPDMAASRLRSDRASVAAMLVPQLGNPFFAELVGVIERAAHRASVELIVATSDDDPQRERSRLAALVAWRPAGIVAIPCDDAFAARDIALRAQIPVVVLDRAPDRPTFDTVTVDNAGGGAAGVRHLVGQGHLRGLVVASSLALRNVRERWAGIERALADAGPLVSWTLLEGGFTADEVRSALLQRLAEADRRCALFTLNNQATLAALDVAGRLNLDLPRDLGLLGFDDYAWMGVTRPAISAVAQPIEALGEAAWIRLQARLAGDTSPPQHIRLNCTLQVRASSRRSAAPTAPIGLDAATAKPRPSPGSRSAGAAATAQP